MEIRLSGISKRFGDKEVIHGIDLVIESGSFTTLLGPSGCGKTTLLRMIAGLEAPDSGEIWLDNVCVFSSQRGISIPAEKRGLGFVFQDFALWPHMTVFENVAFGLRVRGEKNTEEKVFRALRSVKLEDYAYRYPRELSGGQQQRVAFARAIVIESRCILFDEPLSALDAILREKMRTELSELVSDLGITAVFVTHDQTEAMSMSDRIAVINEGCIEQYGTPGDVYTRPETAFAAHFIGASDWIDSSSMFRPEKASFSASADSRSFSTAVIDSVFLGSSYQIRLDYQGNDWTIASSHSLEKGDMITLYVSDKDIHVFK